MVACKRCIYDERIPNISFDKEGICNYCRTVEEIEAAHPTGDEGWRRLEQLAAEIKRAGKGKRYDCVIGVSGGCDSSYLLYLAKEKLGLRPLAAHFDNTWNSKIAVENIKNVIEKLDIDLYTFVMDNREFNDMARAFLHASVPEIDALTDIGLTSTLYMAAEEHGIKYILNGHNFRTEGFTPIGWFYFDGKYIADIHQRFGKLPMQRFPNLWLTRWLRWLLKGIKRVRPLYFVDFDKEKVKKFLKKEYGWEWYGSHHMENRYTAFNHWYCLEKFGYDFRYIELSAFIRSGLMTRQQALKEVKKELPFDKQILKEVKKRLKLGDDELAAIMAAKPKPFTTYKTYLQTFRRLRWFFWLMLKLNRVPETFYRKYCT